MMTHEELEVLVRARGVRVAERLELLRLLQQPDGSERLAASVAALEKSIAEAAKKVREVMR